MKKMLLLMFFFCEAAFCATDGFYTILTQDITINSAKNVLSGTITLSKASNVVVQSDGRIVPNTGNDAANIYITINGQRVSNEGVLDWRDTWLPTMQHSYNVVGSKYLPAGTHTISLIADKLENTNSYVIGSNSNLSAIVNPAEIVLSNSLAYDTQAFNFTTIGRPCHGLGSLPNIPIVSILLSNQRNQDIFAISSGRAYRNGNNSGDAMLGLFLDGYSQDGQSVWPVEDLYNAAQTQAPMSTHAHFKNVYTGNHNISLNATEFPWCSQLEENPVQYRVGAGSNLIVLAGGMQVKGSAPVLSKQDCIGGTRLGCPSVGSIVTIAQANINIPQGHNGIVMFSAKMKIQPMESDTGSAFMWLDIDNGQAASSWAVADFRAPYGQSQKTMYASYLAVGQNRLSPGNHIVKIQAMVQGNIEYVTSSPMDLPLIWYD